MGFNEKLLQARFENAAITFVNTLLLAFHKSKAERTGEKIDTNAMDLTFEDHFDGDTLNTDIWRAHNAFGVRKGGFWSGSQLRVENSNLIITTEYLENGEFGPAWYTSGIETEEKFEQAFGYFECRCKLAKATAGNCAFWLCSPVCGDYSVPKEEGVEIDIMESM